MIPAERARYIISILTEKGIVSVEELAAVLNVTQMTIRRDLNKLVRQGVATRSHGGAVIRNAPQAEQPYSVKKMTNSLAKKAIAQKALDFVKDGDTILLDIGTTTYELAVLLAGRKNLTVITGDLKIAMELYDKGPKVILIGGEVQKETCGTTGMIVKDFLDCIHVDKSFIGISSISRKWMLCTPNFDKAAIKRQIIECGCQSILLADSDKFNRVAFSEICSLKDLDVLITNNRFSEEELDELKEMHIDLVEAEPELALFPVCASRATDGESDSD